MRTRRAQGVSLRSYLITLWPELHSPIQLSPWSPKLCLHPPPEERAHPPQGGAHSPVVRARSVLLCFSCSWGVLLLLGSVAFFVGVLMPVFLSFFHFFEFFQSWPHSDLPWPAGAGQGRIPRREPRPPPPRRRARCGSCGQAFGSFLCFLACLLVIGRSLFFECRILQFSFSVFWI